VGIFNVAGSSECYGDVVVFLGDLQLYCLVLVLIGRDAVEVVVMVMVCGGAASGGGGDVW